MLGNRKTNSLNNSSLHYGLVSQCLHWVAALSIFILFVMGLWMVELGYYDPYYTLAPWVHKSIGMLLCLLMLLRVVWKMTNPKPKLIVEKAWQRTLAYWIHFLIYILIFAIILSGYLISTADGTPIEVFDWFQVPAMISFQDQNDIIGWFHLFASYALMGLVFIHVLGALKHYFVASE